MKLTKQTWLQIALIIISFAIGLYLYPVLPQSMATHWGIEGEANGFSSKNFGVFFLPILVSAIYLLLSFLPKIDPRKQNIAKFRPYYDNFITIFLVFMLGVYVFSLAWNLGYQWNIMRFMSAAFAALIFFISRLMEHAEPNWTIGIRTPWTMSNDIVWTKTHELGSKIYRFISGLALFGVVWPNYSFLYIFIPLIVSSLYLVIYSYLEYRKATK